MLQRIKLTDSLSVSGQPELADITELAELGFTVVVCNRPDGESQGQASMEQMKNAAISAGLSFISYPVNPMNFPGDDLKGLAQVFDGEGKVLAYCRTGTRCANLWVASRPTAERPAAAEVARSLGFDLSLAARCG